MKKMNYALAIGLLCAACVRADEQAPQPTVSCHDLVGEFAAAYARSNGDLDALAKLVAAAQACLDEQTQKRSGVGVSADTPASAVPSTEASDAIPQQDSAAVEDAASKLAEAEQALAAPVEDAQQELDNAANPSTPVASTVS